MGRDQHSSQIRYSTYIKKPAPVYCVAGQNTIPLHPTIASRKPGPVGRNKLGAIADQPTASTATRYDVHRPAFSYHYHVTAHDSKQTLYHCNITRFTKSCTPNLVLHAGRDKAAPPVALAHILQFSQSFKIGFKSCADEDAVGV
ncbi:hypothetical protein MBR_07395, partial [Metarhizium brunneum ARSEF 3297]